MPIQRITEQAKETLDEFYRNLSTHNVDLGSGMLRLIDWINQQFRISTIWALTSHNQLVLLNEDGWRAGWYVKIYHWPASYFAFEYKPPGSKRSSPDPTTRKEVSSFDEATKYLLISMDESDGWQENRELKLLLESTK